MQFTIWELVQNTTQLVLHVPELIVLHSTACSIIRHISASIQRQACVRVGNCTESQITNVLVHALVRDLNLAFEHQRLQETTAGNITVTGAGREHINITI